MFIKVLIFAYIAIVCNAEFYCPFPEEAIGCDCNQVTNTLICRNTKFPQVSDLLMLKQLVLESIVPETIPEKFVQNIHTDELTVKFIENDLFQQIVKVQGLTKLTINSIGKLDINSFLTSATVTNLHELIITNITVDKIDQVFPQSSKLTKIDLSSLNITSIADNVFSKLDKLASLDLSFNQLKPGLTKIFGFSSVNLSINLSNNSIETIGNDVFKFKDGSNIIVNLENNDISKLDQSIFKPFCNSKFIFKLKNNPISCKNEAIGWALDKPCTKSRDVFEHIMCKEYGKELFNMNEDELIDRPKPKGDLEIEILNSTLSNTVNAYIAVCIQNGSIESKPVCDLCKPQDPKANQSIILDDNCERVTKDKKWNKDSIITFGIASNKKEPLNVNEVEGFSSISLYNDVITAGLNGTWFEIEINKSVSIEVKITWIKTTP